jgi:CO/xanthine dehydrogenase FAD-binding subunit
MKNFDYAAPESLVEATTLLASNQGTARVLAGGTDLIVQLREHLREAELVVDVKRIPELTECRDSETNGLRLGAAVRAIRFTKTSVLRKSIRHWLMRRESLAGGRSKAAPASVAICAIPLRPAILSRH